MKKILTLITFFITLMNVHAQEYSVTSPDGKIAVTTKNDASLSYSVTYRGKTVIAPSPLGFELKGERPMNGNFKVENQPKSTAGNESWKPAVRNKHANISVDYNEMTISLREKDGDMRRMLLTFRVMNDGVAFRYTLFGNVIGDRKITRELTSFEVPADASLWIPEFEYYGNGWQSSQEGVFQKTAVRDIKSEVHAGLPGLIEIDKQNYLAIMEANIDDYAGFYLGHEKAQTTGYERLTTKLSPLPGEPDDGVKVRFAEEANTPWRVIMVGDTPGRFIESEMLQSLNPPCAIHDTSWIKPGISAWDHWWSGEVKMEMPVIKQYIDLASTMGWPYMLIDWTWYGPYNTPEANITEPATQLNMPELFSYAKSKNVKLWLWLRQEDIVRNDQYKDALRQYAEWGAVGVKIDFMDRDDQEMVNWYHRIIKATADNHLMLDLHGAYKNDGIERTYPHLLTREGVLGEENYKWGQKMTPEHNITLAFTRMLTGPMDYTPGGFLNVTKEEFKNQSPTLICNTRVAELAKFVVYESPFTVFCDHPDNVIGQPGTDFLKEVPTQWDDTRFLGGSPADYVAIARRNGNKWYIGVLNNSKAKSVTLDITSLTDAKTASMTSWSDANDANKNAKHLTKKSQQINTKKPLTIKMANAGGFVGVIEL